jgi:hypothetical protein
LHGLRNVDMIHFHFVQLWLDHLLVVQLKSDNNLVIFFVPCCSILGLQIIFLLFS